MITFWVLSSAAFACVLIVHWSPPGLPDTYPGTVAALLLTSSKWEARTAALIVPTLVMSAAATSSNWRWLVSTRIHRTVAAISTVLAISITVTGQGICWRLLSPGKLGVPRTGARMAASLRSSSCFRAVPGFGPALVPGPERCSSARNLTEHLPRYHWAF